MDILKEHIAVVPKSQSRFGIFQFFLAFASWSGVISSLSSYYSSLNFNCNADDETDWVNQRCYDQYNGKHNSPFSQLNFAIVNGCIVVGIWITYALYLGPKLLFHQRQAADGQLEVAELRRRRQEMRGCITVYCSYLLQLCLRATFLAAMVTLLLSFQEFQFPESFTCLLTNGKIEEVNTSVMCSDAHYREKSSMNVTMLALDAVSICLATGEVTYLLAKVCRSKCSDLSDSDHDSSQRNNERCFNCRTPTDSEFLSYLLRETLQKVGPESGLKEAGPESGPQEAGPESGLQETDPESGLQGAGPESWRAVQFQIDELKETILEKTNYPEMVLPCFQGIHSLQIDEMYTDVVIQSGRSKFMLNRADGREMFPSLQETNQSTILSLGDIFQRDSQLNQPRSILVAGCAGVGKSMFCQKLSRDWATGTLSSGGEPTTFRWLFLLKFRELNFITEDISLAHLLDCSPFSFFNERRRLIYNTIDPSSVLLVFDGLDEFKFLSSCDEGQYSYENDKDAKMSVSAWYAKLVSGKIWKGCTVVTTSRPNVLNTLKGITFGRVAELCGFSADRACEFMGKLLASVLGATSDTISNHISSIYSVRSLCFIPANCVIICSYLLYKLRGQEGNDGSPKQWQNMLPSTLTEVYDGVLKMFTFMHNPHYREMQGEDIDEVSQPLEEVLSKLSALAYRGIHSKKLLFTRKDLEMFTLSKQGIETLIDCGLLHCMPLRQTGPFCFEIQYCFLHLTLQEFLAAKHVAFSLSEEDFCEIIKAVRLNTKWDLVIQFVAGLLSITDKHSKSNAREKMTRLIQELRCVRPFNVDLECPSTGSSTEAQRNSLASSVSSDQQSLRSCSAQRQRDLGWLYQRSRCQSFSSSDISWHSIAKFQDPPSLGSHGSMYSLGEVRSSSELSLLSARCCFEYNDDFLTAKKVASKIRDHVAFSGCQASEADGRVINYLLSKCAPRTIKSLQLFNNSIGTQGCLELAKLLDTIHGPTEEMDLSNNSICDGGVIHLCQGLRSVHCTLKHLNLSENAITDDGIHCLFDTLMESRCKLLTLMLGYNSLGIGSVTQLSKMLAGRGACCLEYLSLAGCGIDDEGVECLSTSLKDTLCYLQRLDLTSNAISKHGSTHLASAIKAEDCHLITLNLRENALSDEGAKALAAGIGVSSCGLQSLDLASTGISSEGARHIARALQNGKCRLKSLNLNSNDLRDSGCIYIAEAVASPVCPLEELVLQENNIRDRGAAAFVSCFLTAECQLLSFYLSDNHLSDELQVVLVNAWGPNRRALYLI